MRSRNEGYSQLFLNVGESGYGRCPKDGGVSGLGTARSSRSIFLQAFAIRGSRGRGAHRRLWGQANRSAENARLAGIGGERTGKRDPKNATELLGGTHRVG